MLGICSLKDNLLSTCAVPDPVPDVAETLVNRLTRPCLKSSRGDRHQMSEQTNLQEIPLGWDKSTGTIKWR